MYNICKLNNSFLRLNFISSLPPVHRRNVIFSFRPFAALVENNVNESHAAVLPHSEYLYAIWAEIKSYKFFNNRNRQNRVKTFFPNFSAYCFSFFLSQILFSSVSPLPPALHSFSNSRKCQSTARPNSTQFTRSPLKSPWCDADTRSPPV